MSDLSVYRAGGSSALHGRSLYDVVSSQDNLHFTYPPFAAVVFAPLSPASFNVGKAVVSLLTFVGLVVSLYLAIRRLSEESRPYGEWWLPLLLAGAIWLEPVRATFSFGQINVILMALVVVDLLALRTTRWAGVLVGIAAAIKLTPLAFVPFLFLIGRRRAAITSVASFVGCALIGLAVAPSASRTYWGDRQFMQAHRVGRVENASNQSVRGILARLLRTTDVPGWWTVIAIAVLICGLVIAVQLHRRDLEVWALSAMAIAMLIASPISWSHHWVWCAIDGLVVIDVVRRGPSTGRFALAVVVMAPFAAAMPFLAPHVHGEELADTWWQELLSATYVMAGVVLVAALARIGLPTVRHATVASNSWVSSQSRSADVGSSA